MKEASVEPIVLLVDDKPANLLALEAVLEPVGVPLLSASSGAQAVREIAAHGPRIAVMLLDVQMPGLDGFETAALVRDRASMRHLPIIFITAVSREEAHIVRGYAYDAVDYLLKPFNPDSLVAKVRFFVEAHRRTLDRERQHRLSEQRLALALEAAELGVWGWEEGDAEITCDARCHALLGMREGEALDLSALGLTEADLTSREATSKIRVERLTPAGTWVLVQGRVYRADDGRGVKIVGIVADISVEKRNQAERDLFIGILGHDLRDPLNAILLGAGTLADHDDEHVSGSATGILRSGKRMATLVSDMLDFVRSSAGQLSLDPSLTELSSVCRDVIADVGAAHPEVHVEVEVAGDVRGQWDARRLRQVVQNLVGNAIHHGNHESVRVSIRRVGTNAVLEVENSGQPIPEPVARRIFEPFVSASGGSGLGLHIARRLVEAHGGSIELASRGPRVVFRVTLPSEGPGSAATSAR